MFRHFREYHNAYVRIPQRLNNADTQITFMRTLPLPRPLRNNVNNADYIDYALGYSPKWQKT